MVERNVLDETPVASGESAPAMGAQLDSLVARIAEVARRHGNIGVLERLKEDSKASLMRPPTTRS